MDTFVHGTVSYSEPLLTYVMSIGGRSVSDVLFLSISTRTTSMQCSGPCDDNVYCCAAWNCLGDLYWRRGWCGTAVQ